MKERNYGEIFRKERKRLGFSLKEVSKQIGITGAAISMRENGKRNFKVKELYMAYYKLGIDVGLGEAFDCIENKDITEYIERKCYLLIGRQFFEFEKKPLIEKKYDTLKINTIEKLLEILKRERENDNLTLENIATKREEERLLKVLSFYKMREGNLEGALKILEESFSLSEDLKILEDVFSLSEELQRLHKMIHIILKKQS